MGLNHHPHSHVVTHARRMRVGPGCAGVPAAARGDGRGRAAGDLDPERADRRPQPRRAVHCQPPLLAAHCEVLATPSCFCRTAARRLLCPLLSALLRPAAAVAPAEPVEPSMPSAPSDSHKHGPAQTRRVPPHHQHRGRALRHAGVRPGPGGRRQGHALRGGAQAPRWLLPTCCQVVEEMERREVETKREEE